MPSKNPDTEQAPSYGLRSDPNMAFSHPNPAAPRTLGTYQSPPNRTGLESQRNREELREEEEEEVELEKLEYEVKEMARKILDCRATLPDQIKSTFTSLLSAQRPLLPDFDNTSFYPGQPSSSAAASVSAGQINKSGEAAVLSDEEQRTTEKACLLKDKIASNVSAMPLVLKRMKECISKIDKLESSNGIIPPAFKRKKTS